MEHSLCLESDLSHRKTKKYFLFSNKFKEID